MYITDVGQGAPRVQTAPPAPPPAGDGDDEHWIMVNRLGSRSPKQRKGDRIYIYIYICIHSVYIMYIVYIYIIYIYCIYI